MRSPGPICESRCENAMIDRSNFQWTVRPLIARRLNEPYHQIMIETSSTVASLNSFDAPRIRARRTYDYPKFSTNLWRGNVISGGGGIRGRDNVKACWILCFGRVQEINSGPQAQCWRNQTPCSRRISSSDAADQNRNSIFSLVLGISGVECVRCSVQLDIIMASPGLNVGVATRPEKCSRISAMIFGS